MILGTGSSGCTARPKSSFTSLFLGFYMEFHDIDMTDQIFGQVIALNFQSLRRKGKTFPFECRVPKNSKER